MITKEKMPWCFIKFSQLILKGYVWRSVWKICMWILGLKGLNHLHLNYRSPLSGPTSLRRSTTCENISLNGQGQICPLICARERGLSNHTRNEYDSVKKTEKWEKKKWRLHSHFKAQKRRKKVGNMSTLKLLWNFQGRRPFMPTTRITKNNIPNFTS